MTRRGYSHGRHYQGAFTQDQADAIVADFDLPPGWRIIAAVIRSWEGAGGSGRSEWGIALWEGNVLEKAVRVYDVRGRVLSPAGSRRTCGAGGDGRDDGP